MDALTCPACGAPLAFRASISIYTQCRSCGSTILRADRDLRLIGTQAELADEITPLQVGTSFTHRGRRYDLLGRLRVAWADGAWNEWFASDGSGEAAWLAEAQGFLAFSLEAAPPVGYATGTPALGSVIDHEGTSFRVTDIKQATCVGIEGELPFKAPRGRVATYYDMLGPAGAFAGLEVADDGRRFYRGEYVEFDALGFANLRPIDGWSPPREAIHDDPIVAR